MHMDAIFARAVGIPFTHNQLLKETHLFFPVYPFRCVWAQYSQRNSVLIPTHECLWSDDLHASHVDTLSCIQAILYTYTENYLLSTILTNFSDSYRLSTCDIHNTRLTAEVVFKAKNAAAPAVQQFSRYDLIYTLYPVIMICPT